MDKKEYTSPEFEIIVFASDDIMTDLSNNGVYGENTITFGGDQAP